MLKNKWGFAQPHVNVFLKHNAREMWEAKVNLPLTQQNLQGQKAQVLANTQWGHKKGKAYVCTHEFAYCKYELRFRSSIGGKENPIHVHIFHLYNLFL